MGTFSAAGRAEVLDAHLLDLIRRRTLALLRKEVQPVSLFAYSEFLARWQHVHPATRGSGSDSLREALEQLQGLAMPAAAWERDVLPARVSGFAPHDLDALTQTGEVIWAVVPAVAPAPAAGDGQEADAGAVPPARDPRRSRVRLFFRGERALFFEKPSEFALSAEAQAVHDVLKSEGASFAADVQAALDLTLPTLNQALNELVAAGLITHDTLGPLRAPLPGGEPPSAREREPLSALEQELAERRGGRPRTLTPSRYRAAKARVQARIQEQLAAKAPPQPAGGRWSLVHRAAALGPAVSESEGVERAARLLLDRYGVVSRESLEREDLRWDWSQLYRVFQRLELRGEVRRGYFVEGLSGAQFALPEAVEALRRPPPGDAIVFVLAAADPANLFGSAYASAETPRFARLASTHVALAGGVPVVVFEDNGARISTRPGTPPDVVQRALVAYVSRPFGPTHIAVEHWNGRPVATSDGQPLLVAAGFRNTPGGMAWWAPP
jgi:ATP-dependent Lhr-like helicase